MKKTRAQLGLPFKRKVQNTIGGSNPCVKIYVADLCHSEGHFLKVRQKNPQHDCVKPRGGGGVKGRLHNV